MELYSKSKFNEIATYAAFTKLQARLKKSQKGRPTKLEPDAYFAGRGVSLLAAAIYFYIGATGFTPRRLGDNHIFATRNGKPITFEVWDAKVPRTKDNRIYERAIHRQGDRYHVVQNLDEFFEAWDLF